MIGGSKKTTEDRIIELLAKGSQNAESIKSFLDKKEGLSLQAIYHHLRKLHKQGVLIKSGKNYFLSTEWVDQAKNIFTAFDAPILNEGETITYSFKSLQQIDAYWKHLFALYQPLTNNSPICIYNKHCFWFYLTGREESEIEHYGSYKKNKRTAYVLIGDDKPLDKVFKKRFRDDYFRINCKNIRTIKETDHITIIGDLIIGSRLPKKLSDDINDLYKKYSKPTKEFVAELNTLVSKIPRFSFKIERNAKEAVRLQKHITKDFFVSKEHKKKLLF